MKITVLAAALAAATLGVAALGVAGAAAGTGPLDPGVYRPGDAQLQPARVRIHSCVARSRVAVGYWTSTSLALSRRRALVQCALRTPRGMNCFITGCT